jgi:type II secretory pathway pseudopilin PulG
MSFYTATTKRGFALIEILVYLAILIVVSTASVGLLISLDGILNRYQIETALYRSSTNILEQIVVELREANEFDAASSVINDPATGKLVLRTGGVTTQFERVGDELQLTVDGDNKGNLHADNVAVTGFAVYQYSTGVGTLIRVKLELEATVDGVVKSMTFYDGAVIRGDL